MHLQGMPRPGKNEAEGLPSAFVQAELDENGYRTARAKRLSQNRQFTTFQNAAT
jgi:arginine/lysine/ornithine decarboxylase